MVVRTAYQAQMRELRDDVVTLASMVDKAIARATDALKKQDVQLAKEIINADQEVNALRWETEQNALMAIALQQPMARDLRLIAAVMSIVTDLERMADHAVSVAKMVIQTSNEPLLKPLVDLPRMSNIARRMLQQSITAFIEGDVELAQRVVNQDDEVDALHHQIYRELLTYMMSDPSTITRASRLLATAHDYERIADRVTNICERVIFTETGNLADLQ
jgi:phosphate transport system protein